MPDHIADAGKMVPRRMWHLEDALRALADAHESHLRAAYAREPMTLEQARRLASDYIPINAARALLGEADA